MIVWGDGRKVIILRGYPSKMTKHDSKMLHDLVYIYITLIVLRVVIIYSGGVIERSSSKC